jgi:hypothetical protein
LIQAFDMLHALFVILYVLEMWHEVVEFSVAIARIEELL